MCTPCLFNLFCLYLSSIKKAKRSGRSLNQEGTGLSGTAGIFAGLKKSMTSSSSMATTAAAAGNTGEGGWVCELKGREHCEERDRNALSVYMQASLNRG